MKYYFTIIYINTRKHESWTIHPAGTSKNLDKCKVYNTLNMFHVWITGPRSLDLPWPYSTLRSTLTIQHSDVLGGLAVMMHTWMMRAWGSIPHWGIEYFQITNHHLFDPLLHLVANVISELEMHEDILSSCRGECDSYQVSLLVIMLAQDLILVLRHRIFSDC